MGEGFLISVELDGKEQPMAWAYKTATPTMKSKDLS